MASVWFTVIVLIGVQTVFGNICEEKSVDSLSCDECIRCGGKWCSEPGSAGCSLSLIDSWCPHHQEPIFKINEVNRPGDLISPIYAEKSILVGVTSIVSLNYKSKKPLEVNKQIMNSTQNNISGFIITEETECEGVNCTATISAIATWDFCSSTSSVQEFVYAKFSIGNLGQPAVIKFHVACACECTNKVLTSSKYCSGHGNYSCNSCTCESGWKGAKCNQEDCKERGDAVPSCLNSINGLDCSGNGYCDHCSKCYCNMTLEGSQYFEPDLCTDLCMTVNECTDCTECMYNSTISECENIAINGGRNNMFLQNKSMTLLDERDDNNRKKWVACKTEVKDCDISYMAKREEDGELYVTVIDSCNIGTPAPITASPTVSIVLGVLAAVAAIVAVAGVLIYKHLNALPPVPLSGAGYTDIDAEDCVGENPLYKPPTSSFNNPAYGKKW